MITVRPLSTSDVAESAIMKSSPRGSHWLKVKDPELFSVGDFVKIFQTDSSINKHDALEELIAPRNYPDQAPWEPHIAFKEPHTISHIDGDWIRFNEPIQIYVMKRVGPGGDGWKLRKYDYLEEIGVENLIFEGSFMQNFVHHRSPLDDSGYTAIQFQHVKNGWIRDTDFVNMNRSFVFKGCVGISVFRTRYAGNRSHYFYRNEGNTGLWIGFVQDLGGKIYGRYGDYMRGQHHGLNCMSYTSGTVTYGVKSYGNQAIDLHGYFPYNNLYDSNEGGKFWDSGGSCQKLPEPPEKFVGLEP